MRCLVRTANFRKVETWEHAFPVAQTQDKWSTPAERLVALKCPESYLEPFANETYHRGILALRLATDALLLELVLPTAHKQLKILSAGGYFSRSHTTPGCICQVLLGCLPGGHWHSMLRARGLRRVLELQHTGSNCPPPYVVSVVGCPKKERKRGKRALEGTVGLQV